VRAAACAPSRNSFAPGHARRSPRLQPAVTEKDGPAFDASRIDTPPPPTHDPQVVAEAVRHYFAYRAEIARLELRQLLNRGRTSLVIGLSFLSACLLLGELVQRYSPPGALLAIPREGLTIGGWVALWRPMEIYLYDWWPIRRRVRLLDRLSRMEVQLRLPPASTAPQPAEPA
jgi:hypothetical protein